jgi:hypothetical protein
VLAVTVGVPSEHPASRASTNTRGTGTGVGLDHDLLVILGTVDTAALATLVAAQFINTLLEARIAIFVSYGILAVGVAAFLRIAALAYRGRDPDPYEPESWQNGENGGPSGPYIILALILAGLAIILIFTNLYYLTDAPFYLSAGPGGPFRDTWQQTMFLAVGVLCTVQSPPLIVSWVGVAALIQELTDLIFLSGVVTIALGQVNSR